MRWLTLCATLLFTAPAAAAEPPPLLSNPGDAAIVPIDEVPDDHEGNFIGRDASGHRGFLVGGASGAELHLVAPGGSVKVLSLADTQGTYGGLSWDLSRFVLLRADAQAWHLLTVDASEATDGAALPAPVASFPRTDVPELTATASVEQAVGLHALPDGAACLVRGEGLVCLDPGGTPSVQWRIDVTTLAERVPTAAEYVASVLTEGQLEPTSVEWEVALATAMPDGRVAALVRQELKGTSATRSTGVVTTRVLTLVAVDEAGAIDVLFGPVPESAATAVSTWTPLRGVSQLLWLDDLQAVGAMVRSWDIGFTTRTSTAGAWVGHGLVLVRPTDRAHGYLSLTHATNQLRSPSSASIGAPDLELHRATDGWLAEATFRTDPVVATTIWGRLVWDVATMDLDADGLRAAEEDALGTSDFWADSDGGGTLDGVEARLEGTDPDDWRDDGALIHHGARETWFVDSPLVRLRLPDVGAGFRAARAWSTAGPICVEGACYAPDGRVVVRYPHANAGRSVSFDGRSLAMSDGASVARLWFEDGRSEPWLDAAELRGASPTSEYDVFDVLAVDEDRAFVKMVWSTAQDAAAAVVFCEGGDCRLAFDPLAAREDAGITQPWWESEDRRLHDVYPIRVDLIGWDPVNEHALVQVLGTLDAWILALPGDGGDAYVVERARTWTGSNLPVFDPLPILERVGVTPPNWMIWQAEGDFWTPKGRVSPARSFLPTGVSLLPHLSRPPASGWGGAMLDSICCGAREDGVYETVRYERVVEPGDALLLRRVGDSEETRGYQLFRSGPRGGLMPLWPAVNKDIGDVGDMDATAEGELCVADRGEETLWLFAPARPADRVPELVVGAPDVPGILDCLWDRDNPGDVLMLVHDRPDDPRLMRYEGDTGEVVAEERPWVEMPPDPRALLRRADGVLEVVGHDVRGKAYTADGREVVVPTDAMEVRVDGEVVTGLRLATIDYTTPLSGSHPVYADVAVRPDGLLLVVGVDNQQGLGVATEPWAVDLATGEDVPFGIDRLGSDGGGLTIVPGGVGADPWTGAAVGAAGPGGPDPGVTVPTPPDEPGVPLDGGGDDGRGCALGGGEAGGALGWALALAVAGVARRRVRWRPLRRELSQGPRHREPVAAPANGGARQGASMATSAQLSASTSLSPGCRASAHTGVPSDGAS